MSFKYNQRSGISSGGATPSAFGMSKAASGGATPSAAYGMSKAASGGAMPNAALDMSSAAFDRSSAAFGMSKATLNSGANNKLLGNSARINKIAQPSNVRNPIQGKEIKNNKDVSDKNKDVNDKNKDVNDKFNQLLKLHDKEKTTNKLIDPVTGEVLRNNNTPYKQIMTNKEFGGDDYKKAHTKETFNRDITVHIVTDKDKNINEFEEQLSNKKSKVSMQDSKLRKIYADEKKEEHLKKFEYRRTYVYDSIGDDQNNDHNDMKNGVLKHFENEQRKWDADSAQLTNVIKELNISSAA